MVFIYFLSIIAGILYGITESLNKNITEKKYSATSYCFIQWILNSFIYAIPFFLFGSLPKETIAYIYLLFIILFINLGNIFVYKAYKTEDISNLSILARISLIIAFFSGIFLLDERLTIYKLLGVLSILVGAVVIFYEGKSFRLSRGYIYILLSGILFGATSYATKKSLYYFNPITALFLFNIISSLLLISIPNTLKHFKIIVQKYYKKVILARISIAVGAYFFLWSISKGDISIINTNTETAFLISTIFIGITILHEKKNIAKKLTGSLLCTLGIILLNFF